MLILLPPSEGKRPPRRGAALRPESWPTGLAPARTAVIAAVMRAAQAPDAHAVLRLPPSMTEEVRRDAALLSQPTAPAERVYTGVLYEALGVPTLTGPALRRARSWVAVQSALFGVVRLAERIPAYRLSGDVSLPGLGPVAAHWRAVLDPVMREAAGNGLVLDLRSGLYAGFWRPGPDLAARVATLRVLHQAEGERTVVSHFNKATKGRIVRALVEEGAHPRTPPALAGVLRDLGWVVEIGEPGRAGTRLDVVVSEV